jgi:hypothetical protein
MRSVEKLSIVYAAQDMQPLRSFRIRNNEDHIHPRYNGLINGHKVSIITNVRHHKLKEYSRKYTIEYIVNMCKKQEHLIVLIFFLY